MDSTTKMAKVEEQEQKPERTSTRLKSQRENGIPALDWSFLRGKKRGAGGEVKRDDVSETVKTEADEKPKDKVVALEKGTPTSKLERKKTAKKASPARHVPVKPEAADVYTEVKAKTPSPQLPVMDEAKGGTLEDEEKVAHHLLFQAAEPEAEEVAQIKIPPPEDSNVTEDAASVGEGVVTVPEIPVPADRGMGTSISLPEQPSKETMVEVPAVANKKRKKPSSTQGNSTEDNAVRIKREMSPDLLPAPPAPGEANIQNEPAVRQETPDIANLTREEKEEKALAWRSKMMKKVKSESMRFDLDVLWSRLVTAKISPDPFPISLDPAIRDVCVSREFLSRTWGGSSQRNFPPISAAKLKEHGLDDWMYPGPGSQPATPEVPGMPGIWLDLSNDGEEWDGKPYRLFTCIQKSPALWQYQGQYEVKVAKCLSKEEWGQQKPTVRNAWAKKMSSAKWYAGLRAWLYAKNFLGRDPDDYELEQLRQGGTKIEISTEQISLALTRGDIIMGTYTMRCIGYEEYFQREVAEKWAAWVPPPPKPKTKGGPKGKVVKKAKVSKGTGTKSKVTLREEEDLSEDGDVNSGESDGDGEEENEDESSTIVYKISGTRSRPI